ncbi:FxsA family protein [Paenibacillus flagellatus]|uniref:Membrane protein FxsA n=1 Tax=Paenibacillus flagellatus TaxID=2211139 RepID=A0A2V5KNY5_9BACL|nr:FxsA family protein [Paenibacillus flagellatus]PYI57060.1 membrane protein FxsA [Paenibacillus flagellatus]
MGRLLAVLFIVVPALEIWAIVEIGQRIGGWQTFGLLLLTGFVGAYVSKREAAKVWAEAQRQLSMGQMPTQSILDGICIFAGGLMLMSPGFLSDIAGIVLLLPFTRPLLRGVLASWIRRKLANGQSFFFFRR